MKTACLFVGAVAIAACVTFGASLSSVTSAEPAPAHRPSLWEYKVVDLNWQAESETGKPLATWEDLANVDKFQKRVEALLNTEGRDGWELVSYSGGTVVYKRRVEQ